MTIRLTLGPGDSFDFEVKPFDTLTCAEHIRIFETRPADEYLDLWPDVSKAKGIIKRYSGAPDRFIRHLSSAEVKAVMERINDANKENDRLSNVMRKVQDTMDGWAKEHDGKDWTLDDVIGVLNGHGIYRSRIKVNGRTYTAPLIEESATFGQWIDLQEAMDVDKDVEGKAETMSYVRALSILMEGADGPYPVQGASEPDAAYEQRTMAYTQQRREDFLAAPFVDVLGVAAFFFLQQRALRRDMRPQYEQLNGLATALSRAGAENYTARWGAYAELRQAAASFALINAIYGTKRDITEHRAGHVLREMAAQADAQRLEDLVNHYASRPK